MTAGSVLVVTFDGLRRDRVTQELMPNLFRFMAEGTNFINSRSVFPSETRVAISSLVTGCPPAAHGLVANAFMHRAVVPDGPFQTARQEHLRLAGEANLLLDRPSLGRRLAAAGRQLAVVSTATPGASWMMHSDAGSLGQTMFSTNGPGSSVSPQSASDIIDRLGPVPDAGVPDTARIDYAATVLIDHVYPALDPDVGIIWFCDPDKTTHRFGLLSREAEQVQRATDRVFGRILEWWRKGGSGRPENIIAMSDHGQITGRRDVALTGGHRPDLGGTLVPGYVSSLYLDSPGLDTLALASAKLMAEPWCGLVFTKGGNGIEGSVEGTFDLAAVHGDHERAGDLVFTLASTDPCEGDPLGSCLFSGGIRPGGGMHGGLQRGELSTVLSGCGPAFKESTVSEMPCWLPDIAPTIMRALGLPCGDMVGCALVEGLVGAGPSAAALDSRRLDVSVGGRRQILDQWVRDGVAITRHGWSGAGEYAA
ncbi:MAG TPA: alkaline phosphatase family protein [Geminicoccaceae bacterium]|nr:alkaline phosphatase family protein [Geminicoccus sp.]HMU48758.1 alkaline phosphatase family protein [Geminicoccaceae bacterium]